MEFLICCGVFVLFMAVMDTINETLKNKNIKEDQREYTIYYKGGK